MIDTITDLGVWQEYQPNAMPEIPGMGDALPPGVRFCQGPDGDDWYARRTRIGQNVLVMLCDPITLANPQSVCVIQSVTWDGMDCAVPFSRRVLLVTGHDTTDRTPWKAYQFLTYDPSTGLIGPPLVTNVSVVTSSQAKIQLARMKTADGLSTLYAATQALVAKADLETQLWFQTAGQWRIKDPNVVAIGAALKLTPAQIQGAFNDAAKIGV